MTLNSQPAHLGSDNSILEDLQRIHFLPPELLPFNFIQYHNQVLLQWDLHCHDSEQWGWVSKLWWTSFASFQSSSASTVFHQDSSPKPESDIEPWVEHTRWTGALETQSAGVLSYIRWSWTATACCSPSFPLQCPPRFSVLMELCARTFHQPLETWNKECLKQLEGLMCIFKNDVQL